MKTLSFRLTMPNIGSWNGKWSGSEKKYFIVKTFDNKTANKIMEGAESHPLYEGILIRTQVGMTPPIKNYYYNFGDGWGANIRVEQVDAKEGRKRKKLSSGFCGYEWMIDSIIRFDAILNDNQIKERLSTVSV